MRSGRCGCSCADCGSDSRADRGADSLPDGLTDSDADGCADRGPNSRADCGASNLTDSCADGCADCGNDIQADCAVGSLTGCCANSGTDSRADCGADGCADSGTDRIADRGADSAGQRGDANADWESGGQYQPHTARGRISEIEARLDGRSARETGASKASGSGASWKLSEERRRRVTLGEQHPPRLAMGGVNDSRADCGTDGWADSRAGSCATSFVDGAAGRGGARAEPPWSIGVRSRGIGVVLPGLRGAPSSFRDL